MTQHKLGDILTSVNKSLLFTQAINFLLTGGDKNHPRAHHLETSGTVFCGEQGGVPVRR